MKKTQQGFLSIELIAAIAVLSVFFLIAVPKISLTEKFKVDYQAQYLLSNLRLIQEKNFDTKVDGKITYKAYIFFNKTSYEIYNINAESPVIVKLPDGITITSNRNTIFFNYGDKYTGNTISISIKGQDYTKTVKIHSYGRIRVTNET